jgi:hypothetical protein
MSDGMVPDYLGDGLYAAYDGFQIELYAWDGFEKTDRVYLEPSVLACFEKYVKSIRERGAKL